MRGQREQPELVFRGRLAPWYGVLCGLVAVIVAVLALQTTLPVFVPIAVLVVAELVLLPAAVRNRVELYSDHLEAVFGWNRVVIPYDDHLEAVFGWNRVVIPYDDVRGVHGLDGSAGQFTSHLCTASSVGVFIEAPRDGDAAVSVIDNEGLMRELVCRAGLDGRGAPVQEG